MSLTLKAAITATQTTVDIAGSDALSEGDVRSIDSEYVEIRSAAQATLQYGETAYYRATVKRGVQGTAKAIHAAAATLTAVLPGGGTGAVDSVNGATGVVVLVAEDVGAAADDDARLSDTRMPTAHAASHENGGSDEIDVTGLTGAGGAGAILTASVNLTAGQIATLSSVPVQVVAAPGAGKVIVPVAASFHYKAGAVAFDTDQIVTVAIVGGAIYFDTAATVPFSGLESSVVVLRNIGSMATQVESANAALIVQCFDGEPDGEGDGTGRITAAYYVMDLLV